MGVEASRKALRGLKKDLLLEKSFEGSLFKRLARIKNPETPSRILLNYFCLSLQPVTASVVTSRRELSV